MVDQVEEHLKVIKVENILFRFQEAPSPVVFVEFHLEILPTRSQGDQGGFFCEETLGFFSFGLQVKLRKAPIRHDEFHCREVHSVS